MRRPHLPEQHQTRLVRSVASAIVFLLAFAGVLVLVSWIYLFPALRAAAIADDHQKAQLEATAWLVLAVVLFVLLAALVLAFRVGRFFLPRHAPRGEPTQYVDAWAEAGRRLKLPDKVDDPDEPD